MSLDTLLRSLESFLHAEKDWVQSSNSTRHQSEAQRSHALGKLGAELDGYRSALAGGRRFGRLLVAIDESQQAGWALEEAVRLAAEVGGKVGLVHVTETNIGLTPELAYSESSTLDERRREGEEILNRAEAKVPESFRGGLILKEGDPTQQIVAAAKEWNADLIVVGTHGRGGVAHFLLGSAAEAVVRHAHCPVLTVRRQPVDAARKPCASCKSGKCCDASKSRHVELATADMTRLENLIDGNGI